MVKIKKCKRLSFSTGKIWVFIRKLPKGATFNKYNTIIPISKCKDTFFIKFQEKPIFSDSKPLLCRISNGTCNLVVIYTVSFVSATHPPPDFRVPAPAAGAGRMRVCTHGGQSLQIAKKISNICVNFQQNIALIFHFLMWYDRFAKHGTGNRFFTGFPRFPKFFQTYYERGMQLWQSLI